MSNNLQNHRALEFLGAFNSGRICVHPTDTLPGMGAHPKHPNSLADISTLKDRPADKAGMVALVNSLAKACHFWQPLPGSWHSALEKIWPGPLSVVWKSKKLWSGVCSTDQRLCLRVPKISKSNSWFIEALQTVDVPLPSTSINKSNQSPCKTHKEATDFFGLTENIYIPEFKDDSFTNSSSTVIYLEEDGSFKLLRQGSMALSMIESALQ